MRRKGAENSAARGPCNHENAAQTDCVREIARYGARVKPLFILLALLTPAAGVRAAELLPIEREVAAAVNVPKATVVHFWAPWCANCAFEMSKNGWASFINRNPKVNFIFITIWNGDDGDGRETLAKNGIGAQKNFQLLLHPNGSRREESKMKTFLGLPVHWTPATWIYREGKVRYALNYGEVRFPVLQQLVDDAVESWDR
jgi:thiol-disulfide isomerase/thioredoxin